MKCIVLLIGLGFIYSCKPNAAPAAPASPSTGHLNQQQILALAEEADYVDFLFYHMDISVSQNDKASIQQTTQFLSPQGKPDAMSCPAIGRLSIQSKGKIIREADIHVLGNSCGYFTLIENKKPVGTCLISANGLKFFESLISSYQSK